MLPGFGGSLSLPQISKSVLLLCPHTMLRRRIFIRPRKLGRSVPLDLFPLQSKRMIIVLAPVVPRIDQVLAPVGGATILPSYGRLPATVSYTRPGVNPCLPGQEAAFRC